MYAVIKTGGKQYRVAADDVITIEKIAGDAGSKVEFAEVLMIGGDSPKFGSPLVSGAKVVGRVRRADARPEGHFLQEAPPQEFAPQARSSPGPRQGPHHRASSAPKRPPELSKDLNDGTKESRRLDPQRPRLAFQASRREALRRRARHSRQHPRPPARHAVAPGHRRRHGHRSHDLRRGRGRR